MFCFVFYPGAKQSVENMVRCGLSSPLQNLRQEQELEKKNNISVGYSTANKYILHINPDKETEKIAAVIFPVSYWNATTSLQLVPRSMLISL